MLSSIKKDKNYRIAVKKFEIKRLQLKTFLQDISLKNRLIKAANQTHKLNSFNHNQTVVYSSLLEQNLLSQIPRNSSKTRVKNRCIETGRSRSVLRFCKLSRIILREKASKGIVPGVRKASW